MYVEYGSLRYDWRSQRSGASNRMRLVRHTFDVQKSAAGTHQPKGAATCRAFRIPEVIQFHCLCVECSEYYSVVQNASCNLEGKSYMVLQHLKLHIMI